MTDLTRSRPYNPNPEMCCDQCVWERSTAPGVWGKAGAGHAPFCPHWGEYFKRRMDHEFTLLDGSPLRTGAHGTLTFEEAFPGCRPPKDDGPAPTLRVSKIDYEAKTVTLIGDAGTDPPMPMDEYTRRWDQLMAQVNQEEGSWEE